MIIKVDEEGRKILNQLCETALKMFGLSNINQVAKIVEILSKVELIEEDK